MPAEATRRLAQVVQAARVSRSSLARLEPAAVAVALFDARQLNALLAAQPTEPDPVLAALVERVTEHAEHLVVVAVALAAQSSAERSAEGSHAESLASGHLDELAQDYGADAARERKSASRTRALAALALLGAVAASYWAVRVAHGARREAWLEVLGPLFVCGAAAVAGLLLLHSAASRDRAAREYTRLQRGLTGVDAYLSPLPAPVRHLLRATMTQTLFPRLLDDDDPLRQPGWPEADALLQSIYGSASTPEAGASTPEP